MRIKVIFAPEVRRDIDQAYRWYEDRRRGLGEEFLDRVDASIQTVCRTPELYGKVYAEYRRVLVKRFPYSIFYGFSGDTITFYGVFHTSRDPQKWKRRLI